MYAHPCIATHAHAYIQTRELHISDKYTPRMHCCCPLWSSSPPPGNNSKSRVINPSPVSSFPAPSSFSPLVCLHTYVCVCVYLCVFIPLLSTCPLLHSHPGFLCLSLFLSVCWQTRIHMCIHEHAFLFAHLSSRWIYMYMSNVHCCKLLPC